MLIRNNNINHIFKIVAYLGWFVLISIIAIGIFFISLGTNPNGDVCDYNTWKIGNIYQWVWEGKPCTFKIEYYLSYILLFPLYFIFDAIRRSILGFNPNLNWRIAEIVFLAICEWIYLLILTASDYGVLNLTLGWSSFIGVMLFVFPLIILAICARFISKKMLYLISLGVMIVCGVLFATSILV